MKNKIIALLIQNISELTEEEINSLIEIPPRSEMGDFAFPCFKLAKAFKKAPQVIAQELREKFDDVDFLDKVEAMGGYINFFVDKKKFSEQVISKYISSNEYGGSSQGNGKTICIDYSSPNVAKNFHVGHLRTTIIGNSLYKIFTKLGYKVERINHLGDWGTQFGKLIVAYKLWGNKEVIERDGVQELLNIYVKFHEEAEKNGSLNDEARSWFTKMEQGDEEALSIWKWFVDISLIEYKKTYDLLNMQFDSYTGESFYYDKTKPVVEDLTNKSLLISSEGAKIVDLSEFDMAPCLITKNDGSSLYATRDIAAAIYRKETYDFEKCIYVTGLEQKLHFAQFFKVLELMGYDWSKNLIHVPYGLVSLEGGKLSTRKGNIIYAEDILKESIQKTKSIIEEKNPNLENKEEVAKQVGIGAIIFNDLYNGRIKDVIFSWDKVLNFDGETGPYVQYTHARAASVLRRANYTELNTEVDNGILTDDATVTLLKEIERFPEVVEEASIKLEPSVVSRYVVNVSQAFNKFYHDCPIIVDDEQVKKSRLAVVYMTKNVIKDALDLLGIEAPEQM